MLKILKKPLGLKALRNRADDDNRISVNISVPLEILIDNDLEGLNDYADEMILDLKVSGSLMDISYTVVGWTKGSCYGQTIASGEVVINVNADISEIEGD